MHRFYCLFQKSDYEVMTNYYVYMCMFITFEDFEFCKNSQIKFILHGDDVVPQELAKYDRFVKKT